MAEVYHEQEQGKEFVAINALRVLVDGNDTDGWMAQGLEIDYFICAKTEESVKENFVEGLVKTIGFYLREEGTIKGLLEPAPIEVWEEYYQAVYGQKKMVSVQVEIDFPALDSAQPAPVNGYSPPLSKAALDDVVFNFNQVAFLRSV